MVTGLSLIRSRNNKDLMFAGVKKYASHLIDKYLGGEIRRISEVLNWFYKRRSRSQKFAKQAFRYPKNIDQLPMEEQDVWHEKHDVWRRKQKYWLLNFINKKKDKEIKNISKIKSPKFLYFHTKYLYGSSRQKKFPIRIKRQSYKQKSYKFFNPNISVFSKIRKKFNGKKFALLDGLQKILKHLKRWFAQKRYRRRIRFSRSQKLPDWLVRRFRRMEKKKRTYVFDDEKKYLAEKIENNGNKKKIQYKKKEKIFRDVYKKKKNYDLRNNRMFKYEIGNLLKLDRHLTRLFKKASPQITRLKQKIRNEKIREYRSIAQVHKNKRKIVKLYKTPTDEYIIFKNRETEKFLKFFVDSKRRIRLLGKDINKQISENNQYDEKKQIHNLLTIDKQYYVLQSNLLSSFAKRVKINTKILPNLEKKFQSISSLMYEKKARAVRQISNKQEAQNYSSRITKWLQNKTLWRKNKLKEMLKSIGLLNLAILAQEIKNTANLFRGLLKKKQKDKKPFNSLSEEFTKEVRLCRSTQTQAA